GDLRAANLGGSRGVITRDVDGRQRRRVVVARTVGLGRIADDVDLDVVTRSNHAEVTVEHLSTDGTGDRALVRCHAVDGRRSDRPVDVRTRAGRQRVVNDRTDGRTRAGVFQL